MTRIKICGITRVEDGITAAAAGADAIGLNFWAGTPRRVDIAAARAIVAALPPFVTVVGLFVDPEPAAVRAVQAALAPDYLQFHGNESAAFCRSFGSRYLKAIAVREGVDLLESASSYPDAAAWIFDAHVPGDAAGRHRRTFHLSLLPAAMARPVILSGGLDATNVGAAIATVHPAAVDVSSGVERLRADGRPERGVKDPARISAFIRAVRNADD